MSYYEDKMDSLKDIFSGTKVSVSSSQLDVDGKVYPIVNDVIIALDASRFPPRVRQALRLDESGFPAPSHFAEDIQFTFGEEWKEFNKVLPDHEKGFHQYFDDLVDFSSLRHARVCDLGCGMGRWSYYMAGYCREMVLVDFSEAIFEARKNLEHVTKAIFIMADIRQLPFRNNCFDFIFSLGVLHHLPTNALEEVRRLKKYGPSIVVYLYYDLDNRPVHYRIILKIVTGIRRLVSQIRHPLFRRGFSWLAAGAIYLPCIAVGHCLRPFKLAHWVPLFEAYRTKGWYEIRQDAYDRFFTSIEQRFTRAQIMGLHDAFSKIEIADHLPFWRFRCER